MVIDPLVWALFQEDGRGSDLKMDKRLRAQPYFEDLAWKLHVDLLLYSRVTGFIFYVWNFPFHFSLSFIVLLTKTAFESNAYRCFFQRAGKNCRVYIFKTGDFQKARAIQKKVNLTRLTSDKQRRIAKRKERKVVYFTLIVPSLFQFDPKDPQDAPSGKLNPTKWTCPGWQVTSINIFQKCKNKKLIIFMP